MSHRKITGGAIAHRVINSIALLLLIRFFVNRKLKNPKLKGEFYGTRILE